MLTSCLNSDDGESMYDNGCLAKVIYASEYGGAVFKDVAGNTYNASAKSVSDLVSNGASFSNVEMALIYYKWAKDENGNQLTPPNWNASTPQTYEVDLVFFQSVPTSSVEKVNTVEEIEAREYETAPIGIVNMSDDNGNTVKFDFYGDDPILCMNLYWFLTNGEDEFKMHSIRLAYVSNELTSDATELRFYLCHDKGEDDGTAAVYQNWYCFKIESALADFERVTGKQPATIKLSLYEDSNSLGNMPSSRTDYTITN